MIWHIGCSGFYYRHWKEVFYPVGVPQRKWFDFYCQHFNTVELNGTFYKSPTVTGLKKWYDDSPQGFTFAVKAPRLITHYRQFNNTADLINEFYDTITNGLQHKLGTVLFQMPPRFAYTEERLHKLLNSLQPPFNNVIELRHSSWWQQPVYDQLSRHNITFCGMSHPTLPDTVIQNTDVLYYRFHGVEQLYASLYTTQELITFAEQVKSTSAQQAYIYFNNDIGASAIRNAKELIEIVGL
ncbi:DUF72 domain-containing protein [Mucilaginibacter sp. Bleaf8]|uniref:DUF72 domain-containing protein n=1 Tax=Mucilaginibacter sp. Bleaf8 TaxID=2834430 RepID=UPI001BCFA8A7|nr:DUF72 domain-containing protein [Mucilaginibacter sp. Bleaf8]MBS7564964.1 DUF72 domain-containing protein [Mucilaginibacter sp. Bleaf8]